LKEIPDNIKNDLDIISVQNIDDVLEIALESNPSPLSDEDFNHPQGVPIESTDNRPNAH